MGGDGIKFLIDLDSRTAGAAAADTALGRVEASAERADRHLGDMGHHAEGLSRDVFKAEFAMEVLKKSAELAWEGVHKVAELIKDTVTEVADERREKMAMTNLLGGEEDAEKAIHYLDRFSEASEFGEKQTKAMGIELLNAGYKGQEWKNALAGIADAASMSSDKLAGADAALSSFMRMKETGKLDARILRGLHLNVKDVIKGLGDALGMTPASVKKGLLEGSIPAAKAYETVLQALERKTGKHLGEAGLEAGRGLEATLTHLKELPEKIMKGVSDSQGMDDLKAGLDRMLEAFSPDSDTGKEMIAGLSDLIGGVGRAFKEVDWSSVGQGVKMVAEDLAGMATHLKDVVGFLADVAGYGENAEAKELNWQREMRKKHHVVFEGGPETDEFHRLRLAGESGRKQAQDEWRVSHPGEELPTSPNYSPVITPNNRLPDLGKGGDNRGKGAGGGNGGTHIEGKADVVVNVHGSNASPQAIGHAAKKGVEAGLTTALEQQAIHAGTRSARRR